MWKRLVSLAAASILSAAISIPPLMAKTPDNTVVIAKQIDDIISLDPAEGYEVSSGEIITNVYDRIMRFEAEDLTKLVGGMAESWTVSPDNKTFTFKLRPNQTFQTTNDPVTAEDVVFSLRRVVILNKAPSFLISQFGWTKDNVENLVKVVDPQTFQLTIVKDFAPSLVLNLLSSQVSSVAEEKVAMEHQKDGDLGNLWLRNHSAASGAFRLVAWKPNDSVVLERNPAYRLGAPPMQRVIVQHVPEPATQLLLLEKGDVDIARNLSADQLATLKTNEDIAIHESLGSDTWYIGLNQSDERLANPKVREALHYLVDYQKMADTFLKGSFRVQQAFLPVGYFGAIVDNRYKLDVPKAKALLAEAGYPNGFEIRMDAFNSSPMAEIVQSVQQTMALAGVKVDIVPAEQKQVLTIFRARKHQMVAANWGPDYLDPNTNATTFAYNPDNSDGAPEHPLAWRNNWVIPELTKETLEAAKEPDSAKRAALYKDLQEKVLADSPFIIMFQPVTRTAERANVKDFIVGPNLDTLYFRKITK
jgi:peptide/nickel transport system substrate-binding protein